jgi:hypothetical protein
VDSGVPRINRWGAGVAPLVPRAAAATIAWLIAQELNGSHVPFFAPVSAVVALNAPVGERGRNALRLLLGVLVGIVIGEVTVASIGSGAAPLAVSTLIAMAAARALGGAPIIIAQAAISAILTVTTGDDEFGVNRLLDALIGGGVALVFSQVLLSPEPVRLLRRAETAALRGMAEGLDLTARAAEQDDDELAALAVTKLRGLRDSLAELARLRQAGHRVARHSVIWRSQLGPVVRETEDAGHLDLLAGSCLLLARVTGVSATEQRKSLAPVVRELADVLADLAENLGDQGTRQRAADRALQAVRDVASGDAAMRTALFEAITAVRLLATDVMTFAGADHAEAINAARSGTGHFDIPVPPRTVRVSRGSLWRLVVALAQRISDVGRRGWSVLGFLRARFRPGR